MTVSTFVRADRLRLAALFQSKEEARYYLTGVHVSGAGNKGVTLAATDGHRAAIFHDEAGHTDCACTVQLPKAALAAIKSSKTRDFLWFGILGEHDGSGRREARIIDTSDGIRSLEEAQEALHNACDEKIVWSGAVNLFGDFPNIAEVVPANCAEAAPGANFNGKYLADFMTVAEDLGKTPVIRVFPSGNGPAVVDCGRSDFIGVLMPIQGEAAALVKNGAIYSPPEWAKPRSH